MIRALLRIALELQKFSFVVIELKILNSEEQRESLLLKTEIKIFDLRKATNELA